MKPTYYFCNYTATKVNGEVLKCIKQQYNIAHVCFYQVWGRIPKKEYKSMNIFIVKDQDYYDYARPADLTPLTVEEIREYLTLLAKIGFKVSVTDDVVDLLDICQPAKNPGKKYEEKSMDVLNVAVDLEKGTPNENLIVINLIRHCYEAMFPKSVKIFLDYAKRKNSKVSLVERLIMSLAYLCPHSNGHTCVKACFYPLLDEKVFKARVFDKSDVIYSSDLPSVSKACYSIPNELTEMDKLKTLTEKKAYYLDLCDKYK